MARLNTQLTNDEATFISLLVRVEPTTAYQLAKIYQDSPVSNFGTSTGKIYPLLRRLKVHGLVSARAIAGDARKSELLRSTAKGRSALRKWVTHVRPEHLLPEDPLRTMVQSFQLLSTDEQLQWVSDAREALQRKLDEVERYGASVHVPFKEQVHDNAVTAIQCRIDWLDRVRDGIFKRRDASPQRKSG